MAFVEPVKSDVAIEIRACSHKQLVQFIAAHPESEAAWQEFYRRYHAFMFAIGRRVCLRVGHKKGLRYLEDLIQDVYKRLLEDHCRRLGQFQSTQENGIFKFLEMITSRVVLNDYIREEQTAKRPPSVQGVSLSEPISNDPDNRDRSREDMIIDWGPVREMTQFFTEEEIKHCLETIYRGSKHKARNLRIYQLLQEGYKPEEIAAHPEINVKAKTVSNIVTQLKKDLPACLQHREKT